MARLSSTWPWLAGVVTLLAVVITSSDALSAATMLERTTSGVIGWRAWTTHAAHVSVGHLLGSGLVWLVAGVAVERTSRGSLAVLLFAGAPFIAWVALAAEPEMRSYVGLSGLACSCVTWLALERLRGGQMEKHDRRMGIVLLLAVSVRIGWDLFSNGQGWSIAVNDTAGETVRVARYAHLAGAAAGALCWLGYARPWLRRRQLAGC